MHLRIHTVHVACRYHHFIDGLNGRSKGSMNNVLEWWRWSLLPLLCFLHLVVWVMLAQYFTRLAFLVSLRRGDLYSLMMSWLHCKISFSLLHSAIQGCPLSFGALDLELVEGQVALAQWAIFILSACLALNSLTSKSYRVMARDADNFGKKIFF